MAESSIKEEKLNGYHIYSLKEFRPHSLKHLAVIINKGWMQRNNYYVYVPFYLKDRFDNLYFFETGFTSDGGTFPIWLSPFLRYNGKGMAAFLIHDDGCYRANNSGNYAYRAIADHALKGHLKECGVNDWIAGKAGSVVKAYGEYLKSSGKLK